MLMGGASLFFSHLCWTDKRLILRSFLEAIPRLVILRHLLQPVVHLLLRVVVVAVVVVLVVVAVVVVVVVVVVPPLLILLNNLLAR